GRASWLLLSVISASYPGTLLGWKLTIAMAEPHLSERNADERAEADPLRDPRCQLQIGERAGHVANQPRRRHVTDQPGERQDDEPALQQRMHRRGDEQMREDEIHQSHDE